MNFDPHMFGSGLGGLFGGLFGDSGAPYDAAMQQYRQWGNKAEGTQQPYLNAGKEAIPNYQSWLNGQQDPSKFINNLMGQYQQSPYTSYLQQQAQNAGMNAGSASGLLGSTPMMQQMQQNAANIAQGGMNDWLSNVLGINTQYGQGQQNLMGAGQNSANALSNMYGQMGSNMGQASYGQKAGEQQDFWNTLGGVGSLIGSFF
jgi:hypothetical protein